VGADVTGTPDSASPDGRACTKHTSLIDAPIGVASARGNESRHVTTTILFGQYAP